MTTAGASTATTATALRDRLRVSGRAHLDSGRRVLRSTNFQRVEQPVTRCGVTIVDAEFVPLARTAPEDRCRRCMPSAS